MYPKVRLTALVRRAMLVPQPSMIPDLYQLYGVSGTADEAISATLSVIVKRNGGPALQELCGVEITQHDQTSRHIKHLVVAAVVDGNNLSARAVNEANEAVGSFAVKVADALTPEWRPRNVGIALRRLSPSICDGPLTAPPNRKRDAVGRARQVTEKVLAYVDGYIDKIRAAPDETNVAHVPHLLVCIAKVTQVDRHATELLPLREAAQSRVASLIDILDAHPLLRFEDMLPALRALQYGGYVSAGAFSVLKNTLEVFRVSSVDARTREEVFAAVVFAADASAARGVALTPEIDANLAHNVAFLLGFRKALHGPDLDTLGSQVVVWYQRMLGAAPVEGLADILSVKFAVTILNSFARLHAKTWQLTSTTEPRSVAPATLGVLLSHIALTLSTAVGVKRNGPRTWQGLAHLAKSLKPCFSAPLPVEVPADLGEAIIACTRRVLGDDRESHRERAVKSLHALPFAGEQRRKLEAILLEHCGKLVPARAAGFFDALNPALLAASPDNVAAVVALTGRLRPKWRDAKREVEPWIHTLAAVLDRTQPMDRPELRETAAAVGKMVLNVRANISLVRKARLMSSVRTVLVSSTAPGDSAAESVREVLKPFQDVICRVRYWKLENRATQLMVARALSADDELWVHFDANATGPATELMLAVRRGDPVSEEPEQPKPSSASAGAGDDDDFLVV